MENKKKPLDYTFNNLTNDIVRECFINWNITKDFIFLPFIGDKNTILTLNTRSETSKKVIVKVGDKIYFFKEIPWYCSNKDFLDFSLSFQDFLYNNKFKLPKIILTRGGDKYQFVKNKYYTLHEFIMGESWDLNSEKAYNIGKYIAKFHKIALKFDHPNIKNYSIGLYESTKDMVSLLDDKELKNNLNNLLEKYYSELSNYDGIKSLVHGDCNPSNFIFENNDVAAIVDFDNVKYDNPIRDLAEIIITFGIVKYKNNSSNYESLFNPIDFTIVRRILKGYKETNSDFYDKIINNLVPTIKILFIELYSLGILKNDFNYNDEFNIEKLELDKLNEIILNDIKNDGIHYIDTFSDCTANIKILSELDLVNDIIKNEIRKVGLNLVGEAHHSFNLGYTSAWLLEESHITIHTWPEDKFINLDIYVCNFLNDNSKKVQKIYDFLKELYKPSKTKLKKIIR